MRISPLQRHITPVSWITSVTALEQSFTAEMETCSIRPFKMPKRKDKTSIPVKSQDIIPIPPLSYMYRERKQNMIPKKMIEIC